MQAASAHDRRAAVARGILLSRSVTGRVKFACEVLRQSLFEPMTGVPQKPKLVRSGGLGITFIGHSSFLIQIAGKNVLVDPVFAHWLVLLRRMRRPGVDVSDLPPVDVVLQTHAHMDHLNLPSLRAILEHNERHSRQVPEIVVPKGVEDLVDSLGFARVRTLDWWDELRLDGLRVVMTPAQHWGTRYFHDDHRGYGGYVLEGDGHSVYHSGDIAYFDGFRKVARLEPEVALLPIGAYSPDAIRSVHTTPEDALQAFFDVGAAQMIPMHYGTFRLSKEPLDEPLPRLLAAAEQGAQERIKVLREGETLLTPAKHGQEQSPRSEAPQLSMAL
uniref:MBL fold metallo-hydrolase n=1 Tax=Acidobacterium capsulatum TaxID=33075 RepID=A0A7V4XR36_9BACT